MQNLRACKGTVYEHTLCACAGWRVSRCFQYDDVKQCEANFVAGGQGVHRGRLVSKLRGVQAMRQGRGRPPVFRGGGASAVLLPGGPSAGIELAVRSHLRRGTRRAQHLPIGISRRIRPRTRKVPPAYYPPRYLGTSSTSPPRCHWPHCTDTISRPFPLPRPRLRRLLPTRIRTACFVPPSTSKIAPREHQRRQYNARRYHSDDRVRETCCATLAYRECIKVVLHDQCRDAGSSVIDNILYQQTRELDYECRDFNAYRCSGCVAKTSAAVLLAAASLVLLRTFGSS
ncbi:hypothetical protein MRX96_005085 [Rhipicephalus microplus]